MTCSLVLAVVQVWAWKVSQANLTSIWHGAAVTRVSYEEGKQGEILLPAYVDGVDVGPCFLDSGSEAKLLTISPDASRRAKLKTDVMLPSSIIRGSMGGSTGAVTNRTAREFRVGPVGVQRPRLAEVPEITTRVSGKPVGSGCNSAIFHAAVVDIDWRARQVTFYKPGTFPPELNGLTWVPLLEFHSIPYLKMRLDDGHEGLFMIDTGMTSAMHFYRHTVEDFDLLAGRLTGFRQERGIGGSGTVRTAQLTGVVIGQHRVGPVTVSLATEDRYFRDRQFAGSIGRDLLRNFRTIIDLPNKRAAFIPYEPAD